MFIPLPWLGHVFAPHWPVRHVTSQPHELAHEILPHAGLPVQLTMHGPLPHVMLPHAWSPTHVMSQPFEPQVIAPHASLLGQSIVQSNPLGQVIAPPLPSMTHVFPAHDLHVEGQLVSPTQ